MKCNLSRWARAAGVRAVKTMAQTAIALIGTEAVLDNVRWSVIASSALAAGVLSLLTSITGLPELCVENSSDEAHISDRNDSSSDEVDEKGKV